MTGVKRRLCSESDIVALHKELDEVSCPICMDHPHNAVLLRCSSYAKGCRSFICDTSYRHSNCLDRFRKVKTNCKTSPTSSGSHHANHGDRSEANSFVQNNLNEAAEIDRNEINTELTVGFPHGARQVNIQDLNRSLELHDESEIPPERVEVEELNEDGSSESKLMMNCPLCRGNVIGWEIVEEVRNYLNMKKRGCSRELCSFTGNYNELRRHARTAHPATRPSDVDPSRERAWRHLERQREYGDIISAVRSAMPGAMVVGDYVIENVEGRFPMDRDGGMDVGSPWWSTLFLFQMIGSAENAGEPRGRSRAWTRHRRAAGGSSSSERRYLWGENLLGLRADDDDDENRNLRHLNILRDVDEDASPVPRRRRRLSRSRSNDE